MVNRVLIRVKVVQTLYSYMLGCDDFKVAAPVETTSRDRRYGYSVYVRLLLLLLELSGYSATTSASTSPLADANKNVALRDNAVAKALSTDDTLRRAILKGNAGIENFDTVLPALYKEIIASSAYRTYLKRREAEGAQADVTLWRALLPTTILRNEQLLSIFRSEEDFTRRGLETGLNMAMATLDSFSDNRSIYTEACNSLARSLDKAYELYHSLLLLAVEITRLEAERLEAARNKHLPTPDDLNPNTRFVDNRFVALLEDNKSFADYRDKNPISWSQEPMLLRSLLESIKQSELYDEYMSAPTSSLEEDCDFWRSVMKNIILPSDELAEVLESKSVYWNDDLEIMGTFVIKTIRQFAMTPEGGEAVVLPQFKDQEDARFGAELFRYAADGRQLYRSYIDRFINPKQWDTERLALMDIVVMIAAIAELVNYPAIPLAVSLNEYIEIANSYGTGKSGQFINGILYSVINWLAESNAVVGGKLEANKASARQQSAPKTRP